MKNNQNTDMNIAPMSQEPRRRDLAWRQPDRRFMRRLFSMLLIVSLLLNTLGVVADDGGLARNRWASSAEVAIDTGIGGLESNAPSGDLELESPLEDDFNGGLDMVGGLSLNHKLASVAPGDENTYAYQLTGETQLLLSDLVTELKLPIEEMKLVENVSLLGNEQDPTIDMSLFVSIVAMDEDYLICLKPRFAEAKLNVYIPERMFTIRLVNDPTLTVEDVALAAQELSEDPSAFEPLFSYDFNREPVRVRLSKVLEQVGLSIKTEKVTDVGVLEKNGDEGNILDIDGVKSDFRLTALRDFSEIELAVFTDGDIYTIALKNGAAYDAAGATGDSDEASSDDAFQPAGSDEHSVDLGRGASLDIAEVPGTEQNGDAMLQIEQIQEPVSEPVAEPESVPEIESVGEPESAPGIEPVGAPEAAPAPQPGEDAGDAALPGETQGAGDVSVPSDLIEGGAPEAAPAIEPEIAPAPQPGEDAGDAALPGEAQGEGDVSVPSEIGRASCRERVSSPV